MTTTFATIGSGRRTRFFLRLARAMPERLRVSGVVTRDPGRANSLAGPSSPGRGGNTVASLRHLSQALCRCRSAGGSTLVEGEV